MVRILSKHSKSEALIKFLAPRQMKHELEDLANSRNISLSALVRIVLSEYIKSKK